MRIHKEGYSTLILFLVIHSGLLFLEWKLISAIWLSVLLSLITISSYIFILRFFRDPQREFKQDDKGIIAPADGLVVAVKEEEETEFFKDTCLKISVFMSGHDVHINWIPVTGEVCYYKYYSGKHFFAQNPKSSILNERTSIAIETKDSKKLLLKQVAGVMARRVVSYIKAGQSVKQGDELGFIKLGSRIDIFLPTDAKVCVSPGQKVIGRQTILAKWS